MRNAKTWFFAIVVLVALGGVVTLIDLVSSRSVAAEEKPAGDHWRFFDGHWSYWHDGDKRWYYTDGSHWYYFNGTAWVIYQFDKLFGLVGFHHGEYKVPEPAKIVVPHHEVFHR